MDKKGIVYDENKGVKMNMAETELLTIIVPVYNTERYLSKCIESILSQSYKNIEVVLVDDGSTDRSGNICDDYAKLDQRVKIIHKANGGRTAARRDGIRIAKGRIVTFVDSDDWIEQKMYERMMDIFLRTDCDMVSSGIIREYMMNGKQEMVYDRYSQGIYGNLETEIYPNMLWDYEYGDHGLYPNLVNKLFKKELLLEILDSINAKIFYGEDCLTCYSYCLKINKIYIVHEAYYHYNIHTDSTCHVADPGLAHNSYLLYLGFKTHFMTYSNPYLLMRQLKRYMLEVVEKHSLLMLYDINLNTYGDWHFHYDMSIFDSNYILYGAGACGQALYNMLVRKHKSKKLVAWVDKNPKGKSDMCLHKIVGIDEISRLRYDYIVIAVKEQSIAQNIREELEQEYHVVSDSIIWERAMDEPIFRNCIF